MELKTHEVAKELGMAPRTLRKWVQKYKIPCSKNDYGHYVYDQKAIVLLETLKANSEVAGTLDYETPLQCTEPSTINPPFEPKEQKMDLLYDRINRVERLLDQKADEVVSYQLLQQRKEIEELTKRIGELEEFIHTLQTPNVKKYEPPLIFDQPVKTKRRGMFRSIFGL
ncbi:MerR family transcriptional regulator [Bacillus tianshenii]|uniref:MerR family transcriptional regulator n=1 Tax=Sutcliffiella tianshenii TaxID=1463404 RepID=UPI001CD64EE3|nr:MerR family transcriptional regulator [Bacillus tianshenii]MCA1321432.1 MerR family transcriptional regulator [Bacillus tianshenii]